MCGIAGIITAEPDKFSASVLQKMIRVLTHRGPDGESFWSNSGRNVLFGHRRLSIIDLSENGSQPMHYANRYSIIYNGEIYNYLEIKEQLQKKDYLFRTRSDTEVILAAYHCYREECLELFDGMFSFAIWDEQEQMLFAARDRFGEKPFYYLHDQSLNTLWFASEIKALTAAGLETAVDAEKLLMYLSQGSSEDSCDNGATFFKSIKQLPPAHFLLFKATQKNSKSGSTGSSTKKSRSLFLRKTLSIGSVIYSVSR